MRLLAAPLMLLGCEAAVSDHNRQTIEEGLLESLRSRYLGSAAEEDKTLKIQTAMVDLDSDGDGEVLIYAQGDTTCGSGGCDLFILGGRSSGYKLISELSVAWPPIRILDSKSNGWRDIAVWVQGGGILPGYEARLRFDGKSYPSNPSLVPRENNGRPSGRVVIDRSSPATPLYK